MIIIALDRTAELVDLRTADRILPPALRLKSRANRDDTLSKQAEAVDAAVCASLGNLELCEVFVATGDFRMVMSSMWPLRTLRNCADAMM